VTDPAVDFDREYELDDRYRRSSGRVYLDFPRAGQRVEVSIAYVSDPFTGGTGLFIDDTKVTTTGGTLDAEGFESGLGPWANAGAPAGSPGNVSEFVRSRAVIDWTSATVTDDSVLFGFGLEQVATSAERNALMGRALQHLLG